MNDELLPKKYHFEEIVPKNERKVMVPRLYKDATKKKILAALQAGASLETAANYGGISKDTLKRWIQRGQDSGEDSTGIEKDLYEFSVACLENKTTGALYLINKIMKHAEEDGHVALKALTTLYPEEYGSRTKVQHEVDGQVSVTHTRIDLSNVSDEELAQLEDLAVKANQDIIDAEIIE